jgi:hypothetical protein
VTGGVGVLLELCTVLLLAGATARGIAEREWLVAAALALMTLNEGSQLALSLASWLQV